MKYLINHKESIEKEKLRVAIVDGEPVVIPGFEDYEFFTHLGAFGDGDDIMPFHLSEKKTGCAIGYGWTAFEAIEDAKNILREKGREAFVEQVSKRIEQLSNRNQKAQECDAREAK